MPISFCLNILKTEEDVTILMQKIDVRGTWLIRNHISISTRGIIFVWAFVHDQLVDSSSAQVGFNPETKFGTMRIGPSLLTTSLSLLYLIGVAEKTVLAIEESPASPMNLQHYNTMLNSMGFDDPMPEKRAYTYVSEYKRLPVYNFGIGKRWVDANDNKVRAWHFFVWGMQLYRQRWKVLSRETKDCLNFEILNYASSLIQRRNFVDWLI